MIIKILGSGCKKCVALEENALAATKSLGLEANVIKVTDFVQIAGYGVICTPGLVIDEKLVSSGKVLSAQEIRGLL